MRRADTSRDHDLSNRRCRSFSSDFGILWNGIRLFPLRIFRQVVELFGRLELILSYPARVGEFPGEVGLTGFVGLLPRLDRVKASEKRIRTPIFCEAQQFSSVLEIGPATRNDDRFVETEFREHCNEVVILSDHKVAFLIPFTSGRGKGQFRVNVGASGDHPLARLAISPLDPLLVVVDRDEL